MAETTRKADRPIRAFVVGALMLLALVLFGYALVLVAMQCLTWLKTGTWQPVPMYLLFLPAHMQLWMAGVVPPDGITPLNIVPSFGTLDSVDSVVRSVAGNAEGLARILRWLFDCALTAWLATAAFIAFWYAGAMETK